jgi:hypothetical protein
MFGLSFIAAPVTPTQTKERCTIEDTFMTSKMGACPYSPHPANRRSLIMKSFIRAPESECALHRRTESIGSSTSVPSLIYYSDLDDSDGDESDVDMVDECADSNALTMANLRFLAREKFGCIDAFDEMKSHYITTPAGSDGVKLEVRRGLILVKKVSRRSPLFGMLQKYDIVSTINEVDMNGLTVSQAEKLLSNKRKRQNYVLIYRLLCDERNELSSQASSVASNENSENEDISESLDILCWRKGDISLI